MIQLAVIIAYLASLVGLGFLANRLFRGTASGTTCWPASPSALFCC